ncbi:hypothetical protein QBC34DRAFT_379276 [Podospora aff. communis PSN243]|uniref:Uncharacterized protein n=1 Tax=Podospora aff. communis PSN243 TaxID=3040156 RepID=A0AAV9GQ88_9PEZI|nr:hypothetical protein QBC34DRAFT_379276 [Podospora aff. communis PSN243]
MKLLFCLAAVIYLLLAPVAAEGFCIWIYGFFHDHEIPLQHCNDLLTAKELYPLSNDASTDWACTCDGPGCMWEGRDPWKIDRFEWHASWGHYTWYKNRGGKFYDQVDREWGTCTPSPPNDPNFYYNCEGQGEVKWSDAVEP